MSTEKRLKLTQWTIRFSKMKSEVTRRNILVLMTMGGLAWAIQTL